MSPSYREISLATCNQEFQAFPYGQVSTAKCKAIDIVEWFRVVLYFRCLSPVVTAPVRLFGFLDAWSGDRPGPKAAQWRFAVEVENPLGFFESERLVDINDGLLQVLGVSGIVFALASQLGPAHLLDELQLQRSRFASYALDHAWVDKDLVFQSPIPAYLHILLRRIPFSGSPS